MEPVLNSLEESDLPLERKLVDALGRIAIVMRADNWDWFGKQGLNPRQGQILLLLERRNMPMRLSEIAEELAVTQPTISDSVASLVGKRLLVKHQAADDGRAVDILLSSGGKRLLGQYDKEENPILMAMEHLPEQEKVSLFRSLLKVIRELQIEGRVAVARMCVTCRYFRPNVHGSAARPHHCALVNVAIGDKTLRHDCPEHEVADEHLAEQNWEAFASQ